MAETQVRCGTGTTQSVSCGDVEKILKDLMDWNKDEKETEEERNDSSIFGLNNWRDNVIIDLRGVWLEHVLEER